MNEFERWWDQQGYECGTGSTLHEMSKEAFKAGQEQERTTSQQLAKEVLKTHRKYYSYEHPCQCPDCVTAREILKEGV